MLDFARLHTPSHDGDVLVTPGPRAMTRCAWENHAALQDMSATLLGRPLALWRREAREAIAGGNDRLVIVLGHQPEFIHPGVWAKHVVAYRMARAVDGVAINLLVDNDAPKRAALSVPAIKSGTVRLRSVPYGEFRPGYAFEQLRGLSREETERFAVELRSAMGGRFERSQMSTFLAAHASAFAPGEDDCGGLVEQSVTGRRAIERKFGIELDEHRVSAVAYSPLLVDVLRNAERFRKSYNEALANYRRAQRIRGVNRPMPDLIRRGSAVEVPVWVYRRCEARRRLLVEPRGDALRLFADRDEIGALPTNDLRSGDDLHDRLGTLGAWRLRPRALTLTLWARLLLADLFIHGIGGAKYDRITDAIMADYYGVEPPGMACVSATLWLHLPRSEVDETTVRDLEHHWRDVRVNPQRHVGSGEPTAELVRRRARAVLESEELAANAPQDHRARRAAFRRIRALNAALLSERGDLIERAEARVAAARAVLAANRISRAREYFFGLFDDQALGRLLAALPPEIDFAV